MFYCVLLDCIVLFSGGNKSADRTLSSLISLADLFVRWHRHCGERVPGGLESVAELVPLLSDDGVLVDAVEILVVVPSPDHEESLPERDRRRVEGGLFQIRTGTPGHVIQVEDLAA